MAHLYPAKPPCKPRERRPRGLSPRAAATLEWVRRFAAEHGRPPWYEEARLALGFASLHSFTNHLRPLTEAGVLRVRYGPGRAKALEPAVGG